MAYTFKNKSPKKQKKLIEQIFDAIGKAATERDNAMKLNLGKSTQNTGVEHKGESAPESIWNLGRSMWDDTTDHLPSQWVNVTCPNVLNLKTVPMFNAYKSLMRQIQGGIMQSVPGVEFDYPESAELTERLQEEWEENYSDSRLMTELDLLMQYNFSFRIGYLNVAKLRQGGFGIRATHPQVVVPDPNAERANEITWLAKIFPEYLGKDRTSEPLGFYDKASWPASIIDKDHKDEWEIRAELWAAPGSRVGDVRFEDTGIHAVLRSDNKVIMEEEWPHKRMPLVPIVLSQSSGLYGDCLASELWAAQVRIDKTLAKKLQLMNTMGADKWQLDVGGSSEPYDADEKMAVAANTKQSYEDQLKSPGIEVLRTDVPMKKLTDQAAYKELDLEFERAKADMEYLSGITQAYQGKEQTYQQSGVAIAELAAQSSKRVQRYAVALAEGLKDFARTWAVFTAHRWDIHMNDEDLKVRVSVVPQEELTKRRQVETVVQLMQIIEQSTVPGIEDFLVDLIPGITADKREELKQLLSQRQIAQQEQQQVAPPPFEGEALPGGAFLPEGLPGLPAPGEGGAPVPTGTPAAPELAGAPNVF